MSENPQIKQDERYAQDYEMTFYSDEEMIGFGKLLDQLEQAY